ncbi:MAG: patatin-like phospholipase family protein [Thermostichales cyanobacterium SZTDM-1c_bins_54]
MGKRLGLALGSGGARGWAHIGALRALERAGIPVSCVAGASIGAFVGGIYAAGQLDELEGFVRELDWQLLLSYFDLTFPNRGLLDGNRVYELLADYLADTQIEDLPIPFCCVATDLLRSQGVILERGSLVEAIRASIAIPGVFTPLEKENTYLADGGVVNPVPVDVVRQMGAEVVLAVNLSRNYRAEVVATQVEANTQEGIPTESEDKEEYLAQVQEGGIYSKVIGVFREKYEAVKEGIQQKLERWAAPKQEGPNIFDVIGTAINIMEQRVTQSQFQLYPPDVLVEPDLTAFGIFDFHQAEAIIRIGYQATRRVLPKLRQLLDS